MLAGYDTSIVEKYNGNKSKVKVTDIVQVKVIKKCENHIIFDKSGAWHHKIAKLMPRYSFTRGLAAW